MKIIVHADDFGASGGVTDTILECADEGVLSSVSLMANGHAFGYAVNEYRKRPHLRLSYHLNLFEGSPLNDPEKVSLLVNKNKRFCHSFISLWKTYLLSPQETRRAFENQVLLEFSAQIKKIKESAGGDIPINIDSHQHFHMIPFVFDALLKLREEYELSYIRIPDEPFFVHFDGTSSVSNYAGSNILKHFLLNTLSKKYKPVLDGLGIRYCDYFIGVLFTGRMSHGAVRAALSTVAARKPDIVEILFHPGGAGKGEESLWADSEMVLKHYLSPWREYERKALTSDFLKNTLRRFQGN